MSEIQIRRATSADNYLLAEMGALMFSDTFAKDNTPEDMAAYLTASFSPAIQAAELSDPDTVFLIAELDGSPVGFTRLKGGTALDCVKAEKPIEIVRLYASQEWIGHGIGAALMQTAIEYAIRNHHDSIWLDVWEKNQRAIRFYTRWGFGTVGEQSFVLGQDVQHDLIMQKDLLHN